MLYLSGVRTGRSAVNLGDVEGLEDSADKEPGEDSNAEQNKGPAAGSDPDGLDESGKKGGEKVSKKPWFNADEKISQAIKLHNDWQVKTSTDCHKLLEDMKSATGKVTSEIAAQCANEVRILETRRNALKLVLGGQRKDLGP